VRTELLLWAITTAGIQICPASWTKALAVYSAERLHRKGQQNLLVEDVSNGQFSTRKKRCSRVFLGQLDFCIFVEHQRVMLPEKKIERFRNLASGRLKAP
jgi:hypothetical protein